MQWKKEGKTERKKKKNCREIVRNDIATHTWKLCANSCFKMWNGAEWCAAGVNGLNLLPFVSRLEQSHNVFCIAKKPNNNKKQHNENATVSMLRLNAVGRTVCARLWLNGSRELDGFTPKQTPRLLVCTRRLDALLCFHTRSNKCFFRFEWQHCFQWGHSYQKNTRTCVSACCVLKKWKSFLHARRIYTRGVGLKRPWNCNPGLETCYFAYGIVGPRQSASTVNYSLSQAAQFSRQKLIIWAK